MQGRFNYELKMTSWYYDLCFELRGHAIDPIFYFRTAKSVTVTSHISSEWKWQSYWWISNEIPHLPLQKMANGLVVVPSVRMLKNSVVIKDKYKLEISAKIETRFIENRYTNKHTQRHRKTYTLVSKSSAIFPDPSLLFLIEGDGYIQGFDCKQLKMHVSCKSISKEDPEYWCCQRHE